MPRIDETIVNGENHAGDQDHNFSLGDRESRTKDPVVHTVEENTRTICERFRAARVDRTFELNPGNHFQDAELRLAKGPAWIVRE